MKILITGGSGFIGTNLLDYLLARDVTLINVDIEKPFKEEHKSYWYKCDMLDLQALRLVFQGFQPTYVIHLAARTDTDSAKLDDYRANTEGTINILKAINDTPCVSRVVFTSTQFVVRPGPLPKHDEDFNPHTVYGQSKVINEQQIRSADLDCVWTIIRPTNIWGPWHPRYPKEFWHILKKGLYVHPGKQPVIRSYGYVGNVIYQIEQILEASPSVVNRKVYYLGDMPVNLYDWVNGFSRAITGKDVRIVPRIILRGLGLIGDVLSIGGVKFPIRSSRYQSMTEDYPTPMEPTFQAFGKPPYSLEEGINETIEWLDGQGFF